MNNNSTGSVQATKKLIPELRFPEFVKEGEWEVKTLGEIAENLDSKRVPITSNEREKGEIPYYGASGIIDFVKDFIFNENLLCISEDGANLIDRNYPIAFSIIGKTWVNNHAHVLKFEDSSVQILVEKYINSINIEDFLTGMAQPKLNRGKLDVIPIPLPKKQNEQQKIASCLSSLDEVIAGHSQKLELLKEHKKGLMQNLFPQKGEKVPKWRFQEFVKDGEWEEISIGEFAPLQRGFDLPIENITLGKYPVVFSNGIVKYHNEFKVEAPGVVTGRSGTIGKVTFVEENFWPHNTSLWVTNFCGNSPLFVYYYFLLIGLEQFGTGSGVPTLNRNDVHRHKILIPNILSEQQKIASCLSSVDALIMVQTEKIEQLKLHKKGLMQRLFPQVNN